MCCAQKWLGLNSADAEAEGYDLAQLADELADGAPTHTMWRHFSRVLLRDILGIVHLDHDTWGIGANARILGINIELRYLQDKTGLEGDTWQPGMERLVLPIVIRLDDEHGES